MSYPIPTHMKNTFKKEGLYKHLVKHLGKNYKKWKSKYANIVGVNITRKTRDQKQLNRYAVVFHVTEKKEVSSPEFIPPYLTVTYKGEKLKIPTDVVETGENELTYIFPGQNGFEFDLSKFAGSLGPIVTKDRRPYVLSNMHVLGFDELRKGFRHIEREIHPGDPVDINCEVNNAIRPVGILQNGIVNAQIDAAVAFIPPHLQQFIQPMHDVFNVDDPIVLPNEVIKNPFPVHMIGNVSGRRRSFVTSAIGIATFNYPFGAQTLFNLIQLSPCINAPGDSGCPVYEPTSRRILGIVLGRDIKQQFTYVIPYQTIRIALQID
ncbi:hypothetical protein [Chitinophaga ginsengisoli]|uniref:Trypsin-like peptidase n=1 Tax=Chitinophaga ginsengisoli TaxID=363837 RepID=A0A2P8GM14_9BACT|nr:hypothetical protein [Chitinophaga ginsengisoli]PSL35011.1 hypothetical protein CLV42_102585 [Chitinophaga ginsengisoli]